MSVMSFKPQSITQLAQHIVPEFSSCSVLVQVTSEDAEAPLLDGVMRTLELQLPNEDIMECVRARIVLRFDVPELATWRVVAIANDNPSLIHRIRYLCRHQRSEYGKLFHRLMDDFNTD